MTAPQIRQVSGRCLGYREHQLLALIEYDLGSVGRTRSYRAMASLLGMWPHHVAETIGRLERRGFIVRIGPPGKGRRIVLREYSAEAA